MMQDTNFCSGGNSDNISKCCKCNDAPGDFIEEACLHSLCSYCVASCLEARDIYVCPLCGVRSKISTNIYLPLLGQLAVDNCNWCEVGNESNGATGYCGECDAYLCPECIKGHCRMPQFRAHFVKLKADSDGKVTRNCDSHPNEALEIYCETCEKLTCRDCQLSLHKEHRHQWIGEKAKELQASLAELRVQLLDRLSQMSDLAASVRANKDFLADSTRTARTELTRYAELFRRSQEAFFERLETELDSEASKREQRLVDIGRQISRSKEGVQHCLGMVQRVASSREPPLLVQTTPRLLKAVSAVQDRLGAEHGPLQPFLDLEYSECRFVARYAPADVLAGAACTEFGSTAEGLSCTKAEPMEVGRLSAGDDDLKPEACEDSSGAEDESSGLMCCVCDEAGLVVCCSGCERLFHPQCHLPRLPPPSQTPAGPSPEWLCTSCACPPRRAALEASDRSLPHRGRLNKKERRAASRVFLELLQYRDWRMFASSGSTRTVSTVTGRPPDFDRVRFNLENKIYTGLDRFVADVRAVFEQALLVAGNKGKVAAKVGRFQRRFNELLQRYIPGEARS